MVIDIAYAFNRESKNMDSDATAPDVTHVVKCAEQLLLTPQECRDRKWEGDFDQVSHNIIWALEFQIQLCLWYSDVWHSCFLTNSIVEDDARFLQSKVGARWD